MKRLTLYLSFIALLAMVSACGNDEPTLDRQRDVTMSVETVTHVLDPATGETTMGTTEVNMVVVHQRALTADFKLQATIGGVKHEYAVADVPLTRVEYQDYRYTFDAASGGEVTNLCGIVDLADQVLTVHYDVAGHHVSSTISDVFFAQTGVKFTYTDGTTSSAGGSFWTLKVNSGGRSASVIVNDLKIDRDTVVEYVTDSNGTRSEVHKRGSRVLTSLNGHGATVEPTAQGFSVTGETLTSVATYGDGDHVAGGNSQQTENYIVCNVALTVNMETGRLDGTLVIRHVLKRDAEGNPTEWDDIQAQVSGETYRQSTLQ